MKRFRRFSVRLNFSHFKFGRAKIRVRTKRKQGGGRGGEKTETSFPFVSFPLLILWWSWRISVVIFGSFRVDSVLFV